MMASEMMASDMMAMRCRDCGAGMASVEGARARFLASSRCGMCNHPAYARAKGPVRVARPRAAPLFAGVA